MNIHVVSGRTTRIPGLGEVDIDKLSARRTESMLCVGFRKRKERGKAVAELNGPVAPQWGGGKALPPIEGDFNDAIIDPSEWSSWGIHQNNCWKRHRRNRWRRTHLRRNTGELIAILKH